MYKTSSYSDVETVRNNYPGSIIYTVLFRLTTLPEPKYNAKALMIFELLIRRAIVMSNF